MKTASDVIVWTGNGAWLQTHDVEGIMRLSGLGPLALGPVHRFCQEHCIDLIVQGATRRTRTYSYGWAAELSPIAREELAARF